MHRPSTSMAAQPARAAWPRRKWPWDGRPERVADQAAVAPASDRAVVARGQATKETSSGGSCRRKSKVVGRQRACVMGSDAATTHARSRCTPAPTDAASSEWWAADSPAVVSTTCTVAMLANEAVGLPAVPSPANVGESSRCMVRSASSDSTKETVATADADVKRESQRRLTRSYTPPNQYARRAFGGTVTAPPAARSRGPFSDAVPPPTSWSRRWLCPARS
mmetsp:Transcript_2752/g.8846  ORF Transcript_2752/g.8846 Transcript_2752/m.8846 type:complete len:222 (-) Transcript_2752:681-1346(-)